MAAVSLGFLIEERVRGVVALNRWQAEMRAKGEKFTIAEIVPPTPTNLQCRILSPQEADSWLATASSPSGSIPAMRYVAPGKAQAIWQADSWRLDRKRTNDWAQATGLLETLMPAIEQLRADLTNQAFVVRLDYDQGFTMPLPHLARFRGVAVTLRTATQLALRRQRPDLAAQDLVAMAALVDLQAGEGWVMGELVRDAVAAIGVTALWEALQADGWSDAQLAAIEAAWCKPSFMSGMARAFEVERAVSSLYYDRNRYPLRQHYELLQEVRAPLWGAPDNAATIDEVGWVGEAVRWLVELGTKSRHLVGVGIWRVSWLEQDQLRHQRLFQQAIEQMRREACEKHFRSAPESAGQDTSAADASPVVPTGWQYMRYWVSTSMLPPLKQSSCKAALAEVQRDLATTALAIKRYALRHGRLPDRLEALVPEFIPTAPRDWYAATLLRYRTKSDGSFLLYSVGSDGKDNGGDARQATAATWPSFVDGCDLVWPQPATAEEIAAFESTLQ